MKVYYVVKQVGFKQNLILMWPEENDLLKVYWWHFCWEAVLIEFEEEKYLPACKIHTGTSNFWIYRFRLGVRWKNVFEDSVNKHRQSAIFANKTCLHIFCRFFKAWLNFRERWRIRV